MSYGLIPFFPLHIIEDSSSVTEECSVYCSGYLRGHEFNFREEQYVSGWW
jgi:hypothetical protein